MRGRLDAHAADELRPVGGGAVLKHQLPDRYLLNAQLSVLAVWDQV